MTDADRHPDRAQLDAFALGRLETEDLNAVAAHLESCEQCTAYLNRSFKDTILDNLAGLPDSSGDFLVNQSSPRPSRSFSELKTLFREHSRYELIRQLGAGGMGAVYLASHSVMGRQVGIKIINDQFVSSPDAVGRFFQEVRAASLLSHKNIVTAHDADSIEDIHFLVMEYVDGQSLAEVVRKKGRLPVLHSCNYIRQAAAGLKHASSKKMVHRDIKPHNIMLTRDGLIKVLDFGLARLTGRGDVNEGLTTTGVLMGTADFIAPEQARDARSADVRSDIYSLGCTLYYLLSGEPPFPKGTYVEKVIAHCSEPFPDIRDRRQDVPYELFDVLSKMTARDPDSRFQTASEVIRALTPFARKNDPDRAEDGRVATPTELEHQADRITDADQQSPYETTGNDVLTAAVAGPTIAHDPASDIELDQFAVDSSLRQSVANPSAASQSFGLKKPLIIGSVLTLVIVVATVVWMFGGGLSTPGEGPPNGDGGRVSLADNGTSDTPHVLVVLSADKFWYSDYGPLQQALKEDDIALTVTSNRTGLASYDRTDSIEGKHDVRVERSINEIAAGELSHFDAIVFMGNSIDEFMENDDVGRSVKDVLERLDRQGAWITAIGRGVNIPSFYGQLEGDEVAESEWILPRARAQSRFEAVARSVVIDEDGRRITARAWDDAPAFAQLLVNQLLESRENR